MGLPADYTSGFGCKRDEADAGIVGPGNGNCPGNKLMAFGETATETRRWE
jgi:hypothetical protein